MTVYVASKSGLHGTHRRNWILASLLVVVLVVSLCVFVFMVNVGSGGVVHVKSEIELVEAIDVVEIGGSVVIVFDNDIALTVSLSIPTYKDITLKSNGNNEYKLIGASNCDTLVVDDSGVLRLEGVVVTHIEGDFGRGITVNEGGILLMYNGEIFGNTVNWSGGGGVLTKGVFKLYGGVISGNTATSNSNWGGGGVHNSGGVFSMYGGEISSNSAGGHGGGVYNGLGLFEMFGGKISKNTSGCDGGGVVNFADFVVSNGEIIDNTAGWSGGGVSQIGGRFSLSMGNISGNRATRGGGGVYVEGSFEMSSGVISKNTVGGDGGGVYIGCSTFSMRGGVISDNTAVNNGGGVFTREYISEFNLFSGTIFNNNAFCGGGVHNNYGTFNNFGGKVSDNNADTGKDVYEPA